METETNGERGKRVKRREREGREKGREREGEREGRGIDESGVKGVINKQL